MTTEAGGAVAVTDEIVAMLRDSDAKGLREYGVTVDRTDLTPEEWIDHATGEMGDSMKYLLALKRTIAAERAAREAAEPERDETIDAAALAIAEARVREAALRAQCEGLATLWDVEYERRGDEAVGYAVAADELRRALASGSAGGEANSG